MTIKLRLDFANGQLDVEGSDDVVVKIYNDFMGKFEKISPQIIQHPTVERVIPQLEVIENNKEIESPKKKSAKKSSSLPSFSMLDEIYKGENAKAIKDFYNQYGNMGNIQKVTLFIYFLEKKLNISSITLNHLYTCYKIINAPLPKALQQAVRDAKQKTWLSHDDWNDLKVTHMGENAVEHEFGKAEKAA